MPDRKNTNIAHSSEVLRCISVRTLEVIQREVERRLRTHLAEIVGRTTWREKSWRDGSWTIQKPKSEWPDDFANAYEKALMEATVDFSGLLTQAIIASTKKHRDINYESILGSALERTQHLRNFTLAEQWLRLAMETVFEEAGEEVPHASSFHNIDLLTQMGDPRIEPLVELHPIRLDEWKWVATPVPEHPERNRAYVVVIPEDVHAKFFDSLKRLFQNWPERVWHAAVDRIVLSIHTTPTRPRSGIIKESKLSPGEKSRLFHTAPFFTHRLAADMISCTTRNIPNLVKKGKLTEEGKLIKNDEKFKDRYFNRRRGPAS